MLLNDVPIDISNTKFESTKNTRLSGNKISA